MKQNIAKISIYRLVKVQTNFLKAFLFVNNIFCFFAFWFMFNIQNRNND